MLQSKQLSLYGDELVVAAIFASPAVDFGFSTESAGASVSKILSFGCVVGRKHTTDQKNSDKEDLHHSQIFVWRYTITDDALQR